MSLHHLPDELLLHIASCLDYPWDTNSFVKTNRRIYHALNLELYRTSIRRYNTYYDLPTCSWFGLSLHVRLLLDMGVEQPDLDRALYIASLGEEHSVMKLLIESGTNVNVRMSNGLTPLHAASVVGRPNENAIGARILIENGADIEERTRGNTYACDGYDVSTYACDGDDVRHMHNVIRGYDRLLYFTNGYNALHLARAFGKLDLVELLVDSGMGIKDGPNFDLIHCSIDTACFAYVLCDPFWPDDFRLKKSVIKYIDLRLFKSAHHAWRLRYEQIRNEQIHDEQTCNEQICDEQTSPVKKWTRRVPRAVMMRVKRVKSIILHVARRTT